LHSSLCIEKSLASKRTCSRGSLRYFFFKLSISIEETRACVNFSMRAGNGWMKNLDYGMCEVFYVFFWCYREEGNSTSIKADQTILCVHISSYLAGNIITFYNFYVAMRVGCRWCNIRILSELWSRDGQTAASVK
jgi:hypothetical protein